MCTRKRTVPNLSENRDEIAQQRPSCQTEATHFMLSERASARDAFGKRRRGRGAGCAPTSGRRNSSFSCAQGATECDGLRW